MAARKRRTKQNEKTKTKIRDTINTKNAIQALQDHLDGKRDMKSTQVQAAKILLDRTMPILQSTEMIDATPTRTGEEMRQELRDELEAMEVPEATIKVLLGESDELEIPEGTTTH